MTKSIVLPILTFAFSAVAYAADGQFKKDLELLTSQRDSAAAAALKPIDSRYHQMLDALKKRSAQAGDIETASSIQNILDAASTELIPKKIIGRWNWTSSNGGSGEFEFAEDGTNNWIAKGRKTPGKWRIRGTKLQTLDPDGQILLIWTLEKDGSFKGLNQVSGQTQTLTRIP